MHKLLLHDGRSLRVGILSRACGSTTISTSSITLGQVVDVLEGNTKNAIDNLYLESFFSKPTYRIREEPHRPR
jgi:hypothetical protein